MFTRLRDAGVLVGVCGDVSIRMRPPLTFGDRHADIFLDTLDGVLRSLKLSP